MRPQTAALYTVGALTAVGLGYVVYFDYKRRSDPNFRKNLSNVLRSCPSNVLHVTQPCPYPYPYP